MEIRNDIHTKAIEVKNQSSGIIEEEQIYILPEDEIDENQLWQEKQNGGTFSIVPGDTSQLGEKFRVNPAGSNLMSAFVGSSLATLFPNSTVPVERSDAASVEGTQIERDLIELMDDVQDDTTYSPSSFIDSEFEEANLFPWTEN